MVPVEFMLYYSFFIFIFRRFLRHLLFVSLCLLITQVECQRNILRAIALSRTPEDAFRSVIFEIIGKSTASARNLRVAKIQKVNLRLERMFLKMKSLGFLKYL